MSDDLYETNIEGLRLAFRGKVRDVYDLGDALLIVTTDRLSAFDVVLPTPIPEKGRVLIGAVALLVRAHARTSCANHLLDRRLEDVVPAAWVERLRGAQPDRPQGASRCRSRRSCAAISPAPAGRSTGAAARSAAQPLPAGLRQADRLPEPIFTPSTKAPIGEHDENITLRAGRGDARRGRRARGCAISPWRCIASAPRGRSSAASSSPTPSSSSASTTASSS